MPIQFTITEEDYIELNLRNLHQNPKANRAIAIQLFIPILIFGLIFAFLFFTGKLTFRSGAVLVGLAIAIPVVYVLTLKKLLSRRLKKVLRRDPQGVDLGERSAQIHDWGIEDDGSKLVFTHLHHIEENKAYFYFFQREDDAYIIPKRDLSEEQIRYIQKVIQDLAERIQKMIQNQ
ncbi:MAG: YcxB family protein [Tissierellia bacterium]|nr:YcxB family protein [Tissierellia bacterium]